MIAKAQFKLGDVTYHLEVEEGKEMDTLHKIIALSNPRSKCNLCGNTNRAEMSLQTKKAKGDKGTFVYIKVLCKCGAESTLGQYTEGGYFWKEFMKYVPEKGSEIK